MRKAKVLFISQEIEPYLELTEMSKVARNLPQGIQESGKEIRTFMPRFGCINERRNQLHEVIRLSGMNLIIDDSDHPLIIKVASIQAARMQVYFIDNDEYFQRKNVFRDGKKKFHKDNEDRAIFFCRGVLETVKKLGWSPDVIHCHGWMTSLIPLLIKTSYSEDPVFKNAKVVYSMYDDHFPEKFNGEFSRKLKMDGMTDAHLADYMDADHLKLNLAAIKNADAVAIACENPDPEIEKVLKKIDKPVLRECMGDDYISKFSNFYDEILEEAGVLAN